MNFETENLVDKQNVNSFRMQGDVRYKYGLWALTVNNVIIAHGPNGKINALMRLLKVIERKLLGLLRNSFDGSLRLLKADLILSVFILY